MTSRWLKARPGDNPMKFYNANFYNALLDCTEWVKAQKDRKGAGAMIPGAPPTSNVILVQNNSSGALDRFSVLGLNAPVVSPTDNLPEFQNRFPLGGTTPAAALHTGKFAILLEPAAQGALARAAIGGVLPVQIQLQSSASAISGPAFADVADGQTGYLSQNGSGAAQILWQATAETSYPATVWAVVRIGPPIPPVVIFRLTADYGSAGNNATILIFNGEELQDSGIAIRLIGALCDIERSPYLTSEGQLGNGSMGAAACLAGNWWIVNCAPNGAVPWGYLSTTGQGNLLLLARGKPGDNVFCWLDPTLLSGYGPGALLQLSSDGSSIQWLDPTMLPNFKQGADQYLGHNGGATNLVWMDP